MSIAILCNQKDPKPWANNLKKRLHGEVIEIYPEISDFDAVDFLLVWKGEPYELERFPNVKVYQSLGASVDHIFKAIEIPETAEVTRIVDYTLSHDMYEFCLAVVLGSMKNLTLYYSHKLHKNWYPHPYMRIEDTTISILGAGRIGMHVAEEFNKLGFRVNVWSDSNKKSKDGIHAFEGKERLKYFLPVTDYLINLLPYTKETENLLNKEFFSMLKKGAFLINPGRGESLVDEDLIEAINKEKLSGAHLDVFSVEPLHKSHPFWDHPKIQITPHIASITNVDTAIEQIVENYLRLKKGQELQNLASKNKQY